jgi:hypothetical protein
MHIANASSYRPSQEREPYGLPHEEFDEEPSPYPCFGYEKQTFVSVPEARGSYGAFEAPSPQVISSFQKEQKLGEKTIYEQMRSSFTDKDEEYINKIKRPLLQKHVNSKDPQSSYICQETFGDEKTNCCCHRTGWFG